ncbi:MAG: hypothetical protein U9Q22_05010 [Candidatus Altiarchaeota archaeon]|nr:hypothetical protein [Candidatus Altiarchaeota archaeon]
MSVETKYTLGQYYFGILSLFIIGFGIMELLFLFTGGEFSYGILQIPPAIMRGIVIASIGVFMLAGALKLKSINGLALITLACIMLWIFAANDLFETATGSILPDEEAEDAGWFNTWEGFLGVWGGPYNPCVILLPFTLPVFFYSRNYREDLRVFER